MRFSLLVATDTINNLKTSRCIGQSYFIMATKYIAHLETVRNHITGRFVWDKEEFDNKWDAEKRCEEHRKRRFLGAWVQEVKDEPRQPQLSRQIQEHTEHTIDKYCDRFFRRGGRLF